MKKKLLSVLLTTALAASLLAGCTGTIAETPAPAAGGADASAEAAAPSGDAKEIAVFVPSADHGWTGAVLSYAQEKAKEMNEDADISGKYNVVVYAATDVENQIQQVDDKLAAAGNLAGIVILPYDNGPGMF